jgi:diguanylate cyclase (GGDEF)-like protein
MIVKLWLLLLLLCCVCRSVYAGNGPQVLLLNSYHPQFFWTQKLTKGVQDGLANIIHTENLHIEFMDERRFKVDPNVGRSFMALLQHKYQNQQPDVIITSDDYAYYFMLDHGERLFPGVPVVFCGVNVFKAESLQGKTNFTGIKEGMEIEGNLNLIMHVQPNTQQIIMLGDITGLGLRMVERAKQIRNQWIKQHPSIKLSIWDDFTLESLYQQSSKLPANTVMLMLAIHQDINGEYFSFNEQLPTLSQHSTAPIYGMWGELLLNNGVVGGRMNNPYKHGFKTAKMALKVLAGQPISELPIQEKAQYTPQFDYLQLTRFGINEDALPVDSVVINRPKSGAEKFQELFHGGVGLLIVFGIVVIVLFAVITLRNKKHTNWLAFKNKLQKHSHQLNQENKALQVNTRKLEKLAHTDDLTGLANRRAGESEINAHIRRFSISDQPLSLVLLDLDHFKRINDTYGHPMGDEVLCALGMAITKLLRPGDRMYRWGGEEFLISLPNAQAADAREVCERIRQCVSSLVIGYMPPESEISITASLGLSDFKKGDTLEDILQRCDIALYTAKNNGRNQLVVR